MKRFALNSTLAMAAIVAIVGCGGGGGDKVDTPTSDETVKGSVNGKVILGDVSEASLTLYGLDGEELGTASTGSDGSFKIDTELKAGKTIVRLVAKGGTYKSEADGKEEAAGELCTVFEYDPSSSADIILSALTTYACEFAYKSGKSSADTKADIEKAYKELAEIFGFDDDVDFSTLIPELTKAGLTSGDAKAKLALIFGMFEKLADRLGMTPKDLYDALSKDFADDGEFGTYYADFLAALEAYLNADGTDLADKGFKDDAKDSEAITGIRAGIVTKAPASSGINVASSGAVTTLSFKGKQYVYIAARSKGLVGYDITDPATPVEQNLTTLNATLSTEGMKNIGGVVPVPGKIDPTVMVYDYSQKKVFFINVESGAILGSTEVDVSTTQGFSGGSAYISSGIPDPIRDGVWLATTDGYWFVDASTYTASATPIALANDQIITENIGADISQNLLFSPNYGAGYGGGLQLVNVDTNKAYSLAQNTWNTTIGLLPGMASADAGAVDTTYHIGIVAPEDSRDLGFIDLSDETKFSFHDANSTFSIVGDINSTITSFNVGGPAGGYPVLSNVAVDSTTHLMLLSAGYSTVIGVAKLEEPVAGTPWTPISKRAYYNGTYGEYSYARDPHAAGVVNSVNNHKSYGYILSDDGYVLQIDMQAFLDADITDAAGETYDSYLLSTSPFEAGGSVQRLEISN